MWLVQDSPEVVSSREVTKYPVPEVLIIPAAKEDVGDGLPPLSTLASWAGNSWHSRLKRKSLNPIFSVRKCTSRNKDNKKYRIEY